MFGALLCAMVMGLWPTEAFADVLDINLTFDELRLYEEPTTLPSEVDQTYMRSLSIFQAFDPQYYTSGQNTEYWFRTQWFDAYDSALNNPVLALYIPLGSSIIPSGYKLRVSFPSNAWNIQVDVSGTAGAWQDITCTVNSVWVGSAVNTLQKCTASNGGFVSPTAGRVVVVLLNTTGRTGSRLLDSHRYMLEGTPKLYVEIPDPTAQQINDQSIINTEQITTGQQEQTETLMDTNGSGSITSGAISQGESIYENFSVNQLVDTVSGDIRQAVYSTDSDSTVTFPGMSLMGFTIPSVSIDPMTQLPVIADTVKLIVTFTFSAAFLRHIIELLHAIFGIYDYGDSVEMFGDSEKSSNHDYEG